LIQALGFAAHNVDEMRFISSSGAMRPILHGAGHSRQRLPDFMGDRGRETAERRMRSLVATSCSSLRSSVKSWKLKTNPLRDASRERKGKR